MTRSKIQKIKFYVTLVMFLLAQASFCDGRYKVGEKDRPRESRGVRRAVVVERTSRSNNVSLTGSEGPEELQRPQPAAMGAGKTPNGTAVADVTSKHVSATADHETSVLTEPPEQQPAGGHLKSLDTGALVRGFYVFVGLTVLVTAYVVFRSFRLSKSRAQMIRKYGVLAHRQDVEMRPLPLEEEDEEDTTVFDASNIVMRETQHQNL